MKTTIIFSNLSLILYICCARPAQVIQIMTWDPLQEKVDPSNELPENFVKTLKNAFEYGKALVDEDHLDFYNKLQYNKVRFYSPNSFNNYAVMHAIFQGLFSEKTKTNAKAILKDISLLQLKQVGEETGISTLDLVDQELSNTFRVINSSILLEGSSFDCPNKQGLIEKNKREIPPYVIKTCNSAAEGNKGLTANTVQAMMDLYRKGDRNRDLSKVESCLEQFTFATYYSNDLMIKLNAGELLAELGRILSSEDKNIELYSYMIPREAFLGVLTTIQKVALSKLKNTSLLNQKLYWGSLRNFNRKIVIELNSEDEKEDLKIKIQGENNQVLFNMKLELSKFVSEIGPFMVTNYRDFQNICIGVMAPTLDLRTTMISEDSFLSFERFRIYLWILLAIVGLAILVLAMIYQKTPTETPFKGQIEFKRIEADKYEGVSEDESYGV